MESLETVIHFTTRNAAGRIALSLPHLVAISPLNTVRYFFADRIFLPGVAQSRVTFAVNSPLYTVRNVFFFSICQ